MKKRIVNATLLSVSTAVILGMTGCGSTSDSTPTAQIDPDNSQASTKALVVDFSSIDVPITADEKKMLSSVASIKVAGKESAFSYNEVVKTGYEDNGEVFGVVKDVDGNQIRFDDGSLYLCNGTNNGSGSGLDFSSILQKDGKLFMVNQFECSIGAMYMMEVEQSDSGVITPKADTLQYIPQGEHGGWTHCAGSITPWESHLGSEEYETNARNIELKGNTSDKYFKELQHFWGDKFSTISPYYYGWITETKIESEAPSYVKHYGMGRLSHEMAYVMPDEKTVYMSDDGGNTGFFMFIADNKGDLSSGTLYAAKFNQTENFRGGSFDLTWIDLGHSSDAEMKSIVDSTPKFSDIFDVSAPLCASTCEEGFTSVNTSAGQECLKIREGKVEIASRLETRRYAAIKGATTELNKEEGIDYDPVHNRLYVAITSISDAMEDNNAKDFGGYNDIRLPKNTAGAVYAVDLGNDDTLNSHYIAKNFYAIIFGENKDYTGTEFEGNRDDINKISNPDNLTYLSNTNTLIIAEDSGSHTNNMMWAYDVETKSLKRIATLPVGAEATSTAFYRNINGYSYLSLVTQHPTDDKESTYGLFSTSSDLQYALTPPTTQVTCEASGMTWDGTLCSVSLETPDYSIAAPNDIVNVAASSCYTEGNGVVFGSDFQCGLMQPWSVYSEASSADWVISSYGSSTYAYISGYGADEPSKDWLISPKLTLTGDEVLTFRSAKGYNGSDIVVKISTDYIGSGDPKLATWNALSAVIATTDNGNYKWTDSGDVNLSAYTGDAYIAFYHEAPGTGSNEVANWEVDDVVISGSGTAYIPFQTAFSISKKSVLTDEYIEFKSSVSGGEAPYSLAWNMGNGETRTDSTFCYKYPTDGNYTVVLNVTDGQNAATAASDNIIVNAPLDEQVPTKVGDLRIATYNAYLNRTVLGELYEDLNAGNDKQVENVANIIQQVNPDVILINEFDYNGDSNVELLKSKYLNVSQGLGDAIDYPYYFVAASNTGIQSGKDYNGDGKFNGDDAFGFGDFAGQYGMVILSKYPILTTDVRTFQTFLWKDMPGHLVPTKADGTAYFSDDVMSTYRLSSKSHWDIPVNVNGKVFHVLADHPTPPTFDDGDKDGLNNGADNVNIIDWNGLRNHDEIRLWADYVKGDSYMYDDKQISGGLAADKRFVILGDHNADKDEGDSYRNAIMQLLDNPFINATVTPLSKGATSEGVSGRDDDDTANWSMHADYVLPSTFGFDINQCGVYWPQLTDKKHYLVEKNPAGGENSSDHRLVWCDLNIIDTNSTQVVTGGTETNSTDTNTTSSATTGFIFSEYIEGSSNNKAVELYNASDAAISLSEYKIVRYSNGGTAGTDILLDAYTLNAGSTFVLANSSSAAELLAFANQTSSALNHNGDDALALVHIATNTIVDVIGKIGEDP
ncbi:MAG: endonuclease/exonuclease/phosphatase family protein, partial [Helicobacteraceae bacterium]|nr:endonuclease/exonuclease/phosphatase family protein [Helicobacteraceae bacterium]